MTHRATENDAPRDTVGPIVSDPLRSACKVDRPATGPALTEGQRASADDQTKTPTPGDDHSAASGGQNLPIVPHTVSTLDLDAIEARAVAHYPASSLAMSVVQATDDVRALLEEVRRLRDDAARLDWLDAVLWRPGDEHTDGRPYIGDVRFYGSWTPGARRAVQVGDDNQPIHDADHVRFAIDMARAWEMADA